MTGQTKNKNAKRSLENNCNNKALICNCKRAYPAAICRLGYALWVYPVLYKHQLSIFSPIHSPIFTGHSVPVASTFAISGFSSMRPFSTSSTIVDPIKEK